MANGPLYRGLFVWLILATMLIFLGGCAEPNSGKDEYLAEEHEHEDVHEEDHIEGIIELDSSSGELAGIQLVESTRMPFRNYLETTGVVSVNEGKIAHIRPLSKGVVEQVFVLPGDDVVSQQPLLRYDNIEMSELLSEYQSRQAELRRAKTELEVNRKLWERGKQLFAAQAIAENDLDLRQAEYQRAQETVNILQSEIKKHAAKLRRYGLTEEEFESAGDSSLDLSSHLRSPFSGTVIEFDVAEGEVIAADRVVMSISDLSTVWVHADVYERDIGKIEQKGEVEVLIPAYLEQIFRGSITYLGDTVDPETRTVRVRAELPNPQRKLKLGMYGKVRISLGTQRELPAVPVEAIQEIGGEAIVFVQIEPGRFERRVVRTGPKEGGWISIEEGLAAGEEVAGRGSFSLKSELLKERLGGGHAH